MTDAKPIGAGVEATRMYSQQQLAAAVGVTPRSIQRYQRRGLKRIKLDGGVYILGADWIEFVRRHGVTHES